MAKMGKYLYCFINEKNNVTFGTSELGGLNAPVYGIQVRDISAVISDAPIIDYEPTRKSMLAHQRIIVKAMEKYAVVPVSFGTVADNKKDIETIINSYYDELFKALGYLKNRVELGLRVTWNKGYFNNDIENDEITKLKNKIAGKAENEVLKDKIYLGQLVERSILAKREEYLEKIYQPLENIAVEGKQNEKLAIKGVFNAYFLVEKERESEFDKKVEALAECYSGKLDFMYTGPWPPYNFININISLN